MDSGPACLSVGPGFNSLPGTLGVPWLSKSAEGKLSDLHILVHIQCGDTIKYCKSPIKV